MTSEHSQLVDITPEMAKQWLETSNTHNRKIYRRVIENYSRDMKEGRWRLTSQGIAFSPSGILMDGQHRLHAIVESGKTIRMFVFFNISKESQIVIDQGKPRSMADALTLEGDMGVVSNEEVATLRAMLRGARVKGGHVKQTIQEERESLKKHWESIRFAQSLVRTARGGTRGVRSATTRAVMARAWYTQDHNEIARFCEVLSKGIGNGPTDSGAVLLWQFLVQSGNNGNGSSQLVERYLKTERALQAFIKKESLSKLYAASGELFPLPDESVK